MKKQPTQKKDMDKNTYSGIDPIRMDPLDKRTAPIVRMQQDLANLAWELEHSGVSPEEIEERTAPMQAVIDQLMALALNHREKYDKVYNKGYLMALAKLLLEETTAQENRHNLRDIFDSSISPHLMDLADGPVSIQYRGKDAYPIAHLNQEIMNVSHNLRNLGYSQKEINDILADDRKKLDRLKKLMDTDLEEYRRRYVHTNK